MQARCDGDGSPMCSSSHEHRDTCSWEIRSPSGILPREVVHCVLRREADEPRDRLHLPLSREGFRWAHWLPVALIRPNTYPFNDTVFIPKKDVHSFISTGGACELHPCQQRRATELSEPVRAST